MIVLPSPPANYPTVPGFFRDFDLRGLELQYDFYFRAYAGISPDDLPGPTRARVLYIISCLQLHYDDENSPSA
jgi:hypothetical protein